MKNVLFLCILAVAGWYLYGWLQKQNSSAKVQQSAPVRYTQSLVADVKKAAQAAAKANVAIQQETQDAKKLLQENESK